MWATDLGLNSSEIALESTESALKCNDASQIIAQLISWLNQLRLVTNPRLHNSNKATVHSNPSTKPGQLTLSQSGAVNASTKIHMFTIVVPLMCCEQTLTLNSVLLPLLVLCNYCSATATATTTTAATTFTMHQSFITEFVPTLCIVFIQLEKTLRAKPKKRTFKIYFQKCKTLVTLITCNES